MPLMTVFRRDSHNLTYMLDEMVDICVEALQEELESEVFGGLRSIISLNHFQCLCRSNICIYMMSY